MKDLKHPGKSLYQNELNIEDGIIASEEEYHMVTGANRQLHRQSSQNPNDTIGSHVDQNLSNSTTRPLDPVNQIAIAMEKLEKRSRIHYCFTQKQPPSHPHHFKKTVVENPVDQPTELNTKYV